MQKLSFMLLFHPVSITVMPFSSACPLVLLDYNIFKTRILTLRTKRSAHITPILADLHWLTVAYRINFKMILLTFKALNGLAPYYLCNLLVPYSPPRSLRSSDSESLGIASLPWVADRSVLLPLNYQTLYQDHSAMPIACRNSNRCSKLTQNVIFLSSLLVILFCCILHDVFFSHYYL